MKSTAGAGLFAEGLFDYVYGRGPLEARFTRWIDVVESLPRRRTRVLTWPVSTVFGFIGDPGVHMFLKPTVTKIAARTYGVAFEYASRPNWGTYRSLTGFCRDNQTRPARFAAPRHD